MATRTLEEERSDFAQQKKKIDDDIERLGEFMRARLTTTAPRPFSLPSKHDGNGEDYNTRESFFPPSLVARATTMVLKLFETVDPTNELRTRISLLEHEAPLLPYFHNTLIRLVGLTWFAVARGWDAEIVSLLQDDHTPPPSPTRAVSIAAVELFGDK